MKKIIVCMALLVSTAAASQVGSLEKLAVNAVQQTPVSTFDAELSGSSFGNWFNQLVGPEAVAVWLLNECGTEKDRTGGAERDPAACVEANAILRDGRHVSVAISVGTFKTGISGNPAFYSAVVMEDNHLYRVQRLRDLSDQLRAQENLDGRQRDVTRSPSIVITSPKQEEPKEPQDSQKPQKVSDGVLQGSSLVSAKPFYPPAASDSPPAGTATSPAPDPPPAGTTVLPKPEEPKEPADPQKPRKVLEGVLQGNALIKVKPVYPANARSLNALGSVEVQIIVSEDGRVIDAKAVSGHPVLRGPAVAAARGWVFTPTTLNGVPVKVESVLTFVFQ